MMPTGIAGHTAIKNAMIPTRAFLQLSSLQPIGTATRQYQPTEQHNICGEIAKLQSGIRSHPWGNNLPDCERSDASREGAQRPPSSLRNRLGRTLRLRQRERQNTARHTQ